MTLAAWHQTLLRIAGWAPDGLVCTARAQLADGRLKARRRDGSLRGHGLRLRPARRRSPPDYSDARVGRRPADGGGPAHGAPARPALRAVVDAARQLVRDDRPERARDRWRLAGLAPARSAQPVAAATGGVCDPGGSGRRRAGSPDRAAPGSVGTGRRTRPTGRGVRRLGRTGAVPSGRAGRRRAGLDPTQRWRADRGRGLRSRVTTGGPGYRPDRSRLSRSEQDRVVSYLDGGTRVIASSARLDDVLDTNRHAVVPTGFRTDGVWIWCDASTYYARTHAIAPEPGLRDHIARRPDPAPAPADCGASPTSAPACTHCWRTRADACSTCVTAARPTGQLSSSGAPDTAQTWRLVAV